MMSSQGNNNNQAENPALRAYYARIDYDYARQQFDAQVSKLQKDYVDYKRKFLEFNPQKDEYLSAINNIRISSLKLLSVFNEVFEETNTGTSNDVDVNELIKFLNKANEILVLTSKKSDLQQTSEEEKNSSFVDSARMAPSINELKRLAGSISGKIAPYHYERFAGAIGMLLGSVIALVTLGYITSLFNSSYSLFSNGSRSKVVANFLTQITDKSNLKMINVHSQDEGGNNMQLEM